MSRDRKIPGRHRWTPTTTYVDRDLEKFNYQNIKKIWPAKPGDILESHFLPTSIPGFVLLDEPYWC